MLLEYKLPVGPINSPHAGSFLNESACVCYFLWENVDKAITLYMNSL